MTGFHRNQRSCIQCYSRISSEVRELSRGGGGQWFKVWVHCIPQCKLTYCTKNYKLSNKPSRDSAHSRRLRASRTLRGRLEPLLLVKLSMLTRKGVFTWTVGKLGESRGRKAMGLLRNAMVARLQNLAAWLFSSEKATSRLDGTCAKRVGSQSLGVTLVDCAR